MSTAVPDPDKNLNPGEVNPDYIPHDWPLTPLQGKKAYIPGWNLARKTKSGKCARTYDNAPSLQLPLPGRIVQLATFAAVK